MVLHFKVAFFVPPPWAEECTYCGTWLRGGWYMWDRVVQGSINGPSCFGRLSALTARLSQSLIDTTELRMQVYTDDPCMTLRGSRKRCEIIAAMVVTTWLTLGRSLSDHKAQLAHSVNWIGYTISINKNFVSAKIRAEFMQEFEALTSEMLALPHITTESLRSYAGKANHTAALVYHWRPFLDQIWAALNIKRAGRTPVGAHVPYRNSG